MTDFEAAIADLKGELLVDERAAAAQKGNRAARLARWIIYVDDWAHDASLAECALILCQRERKTASAQDKVYDLLASLIAGKLGKSSRAEWSSNLKLMSLLGPDDELIAAVVKDLGGFTKAAAASGTAFRKSQQTQARRLSRKHRKANQKKIVADS